MRRSVLIALAVILAGLATPAAASADSFSIVSFTNGYSGGLNLTSSNWSVASTFSFNIQIADPLSVGFVFIDGDGTIVPDYRLLRVNYQFLDRARLGLSFGSTGTTMVTGIGFDIVAFRKKIQEAVATESRVQIDYLFTPTVSGALTSGNLLMGLAVGIGM